MMRPLSYCPRFCNHSIWSKLNCPATLSFCQGDNAAMRSSAERGLAHAHTHTLTHTNALMVWVVAVIDGSHLMIRMRGGFLSAAGEEWESCWCCYIRHPVSRCCPGRSLRSPPCGNQEPMAWDHYLIRERQICQAVTAYCSSDNATLCGGPWFPPILKE